MFVGLLLDSYCRLNVVLDTLIGAFLSSGFPFLIETVQNKMARGSSYSSLG